MFGGDLFWGWAFFGVIFGAGQIFGYFPPPFSLKSPEIEKPYMKFTVTLISSAEQSLKSIFFSSHLRAASKYSDMAEEVEVCVLVSPQVESCKTMKE